MPDVRVLIVDDSVAVRRALGDTIDREPGLAVCGAAPNGALGLELVERAHPDVVVLDLEMPVLDGLEFLTRLRPQHPRLPVLVFSGTAGHANEATLEALWRGASDYLLKPRGLDARAMDEFLRAELVPRLRALARVPAAPAPAAPAPTRSAGPATQAKPFAPALGAPARSAGPVAIPARDPVPALLVVGASTGGPRALATALGELPADFPLPIAVVQHMPTEMSEFLASGLSANCRMRVRLAEDGGAVEPGVLWVAPGGAHLTIGSEGGRARFRLDHEPEENGCRPAVDPLFRSAARVFGAGTLALVLTGMGQDGVAGARAVRAAGGRVLVQDEASSVVWGMPGAIARAGLADVVLPLAQLAGELVARARNGGARPPRQAEAA